jgi:hypothetical protein
MTNVIAAKATACVSDRVNVPSPAETAVVYIKDDEDDEGCYVGWLARVACDDEAQEDCGPLELPDGEFFMYGDIHSISNNLGCWARLLHFRFTQIIELIQDPTNHHIKERRATAV